jgi:predicted nuclease with TOPRIM domain
LAGEKTMQVVEMKTKLEERIKALEKEKSTLLEEIGQLKEVVGLSEKAKGLENEVNKLKREVKTLKDRIPREFLQELGEVESTLLEESEEEKKLSEECTGCVDEEFL